MTAKDAVPSPAETSLGGPATESALESANDHEIVKRVMSASLELQAAMDDAVKRGLIVKPRFEKRNDRFIGTRASYVCSVSVFRKLG